MTIRRIPPTVLLPAAVIMLLAPVLFTGESFFIRDITYLFHPWKTICSEMVVKGELPLWNKFAYSGMPLLANWQTAVYYPFSLLFYLLPFASALKLYQALHLLLAGTFAYLFMRSLKFNRWPSLAAGMVFALNGYMVTRLEFLSHIGVDTWLFALLLFSGNRYLLALALAIAFTAGHQIFLVLGAILILYLVFVDTAPFALKTRNFGISALLAAGIACCQLLPTLELARLSARVHEGITAATALLNSVRPGDLPGIISPYLAHASTAVVAGEKFPWASTFYAGGIAFFLMLLGAVQMRYRRIILFAFMIVITGVLLSLGDTIPLYPWLYEHVPFFKFMRYPSQFMILAAAGISMLAACGAARLRIRGVIVLLVAVELLLTASHFQETTADAFFSHRPVSAAFLQASAPGRRFILSPGTELNRRFKNLDTVAAWQESRNLLFGLTSLPYHLSNTYGSGEPLTLSTLENAVNRAYGAVSAATALPLYSELGAGHLICRKPLIDAAGYSPVFVSNSILIYRLDTLPENFIAAAGSSVNVVHDSPGRLCFDATLQTAGTVVWREVYCPGWRAYVNGEKTAISPWNDLFRSIVLPAGSHRIYQVYRPLSSVIGILISILFIVLVTVIGAMKLGPSSGRGNEP